MALTPWMQINEFHDATDYGIYFAFGLHRVYGDHVLLYVGLASDRSFGTRIPEHGDWYGTEQHIAVGD